MCAQVGLLICRAGNKCRDLTNIEEGKPLAPAGSLSAHTRPVEALAACQLDGSSAVLYTADTMGIIKVWELRKEDGPNPRWRSTQKVELTYHRTKINEISYGNGQLWSGAYMPLFVPSACILNDVRSVF